MKLINIGFIQFLIENNVYRLVFDLNNFNKIQLYKWY